MGTPKSGLSTLFRKGTAGPGIKIMILPGLIICLQTANQKKYIDISLLAV